jgi:alpha-tubulin suppressor-like RCC1 family protein
MAAWGANQAGQLGNNSTTASSVPVAVPRQGAIAGKTVIGLSAGGDHSLAVCSDGTVAAWGLNSSGQLGNASNNTSYVPVAVTMTTGALLNKRVVSVSASAAHSLALCLDETVVAWGANPNGSLGNNSTTTSNIPVAVTGAGVLSSKKVAAVNAGGAQSFALCTDGSLAGWGLNTYGQLGNNSSETARVPVAVTTTSGALFGKTVVSISVGHAHALVRFSDGGMAAWGGNAEGQLGNNTTTNSNIPVEVFKGGILAGKTVAAVSAGYAHNVALCSDGTVATWGSNSWGQLGNGSSIVSSVIPVNITGLGALAGRTVVAVSAGANHCLALCSDGRVAAWGRGDSGQLGVGGFSTSSLPVEVKWDGVLTGKSVVEISAGADHSLARCSDGTLVAWGSNVFGQLGINLGGNRAAPVLVETGSGALMGKTVVATAAGTTHSLALCSDGTLAAWGSNAEGQLGSIGTNGSYVPISVTTNIGALYGKTVRRIACGQYHNLALCTDGSLAAWGQGTSGQLGNSSVVNSDIPESVTSAGVLSGKSVWTIASGGSSSFVLAGAPMLPSLSNLTLNAGSLSPAFSPETTSYAASFANSVSSVILKPSAADSTAVVKVNGTVVPSGSASAPIPLSFGTNTITITITATAQDGMTTKTYTVTVTRAASSVATLSGLALTTGTLSPAFSSETTTYTSSASNTTSSLKVNPTATVSTAMIKINGTAVLSGSASSSIPLSFGTNTIAIQVMAQDGTTAMTYTVKVTRSASSVNTLSGLALKSATLSPKFNKTKSVYTASVASSVSSLKVRPTATSNLATIKVNGSKVKSGSLSKAIALKRGKNTIKVVVTAQDGTTKTYRITVTRGGVAKAIAISAARNSSIQKRAIPEIAEITKTIVEEQPYLQITLMKGNENTTRVVEVSSNLVDWYSGHHHTTTLIDDESMLRVRDNTSIKSGKMRYIRLRQIP